MIESILFVLLIMSSAWVIGAWFQIGRSFISRYYPTILHVRHSITYDNLDKQNAKVKK